MGGENFEIMFIILGKTIPGTNLEISDVHFDVFREALIALFILSRLFLLRYRLQGQLVAPVLLAVVIPLAAHTTY